jgi:hypothetical protein
MSKPYWWFKGASVEELTKRLTANPGCRLEVHLDDQKMTFVVKPAGEVTAMPFDPPINESHVCPPFC